SLCRFIVDERVFRQSIIGAFMVFDAKCSQIVAERQQPVVLPIMPDTAKDGSLFEHEPLVRLDSLLWKLQGPLTVGHDIDDMFSDCGLRRPERDAAKMFTNQHRIIVEHLERRRTVVNRVSINAGDVEGTSMLPAQRSFERRRDTEQRRILSL